MLSWQEERESGDRSGILIKVHAYQIGRACEWGVSSEL